MTAPEETEPVPIWRKCMICGERFDENKDPNHLDACRDSIKP